MAEQFVDQNLVGAQFRSVNLQQARFEDVNLAEAVITNANLHNMVIEDANVSGLTIFGLRIDELIEAEWDRRDPQRAQLSIADPTDLAQVRTIMAHLDALRTDFRARLQATAPHLLAARPSADQWSALEHVRHLVFADALYLSHSIGGLTTPLPAIGLLSDHLAHEPAYANVGSQPSDDLKSVIAEWEAVNKQLPLLLAELTSEQLRRTASNGQTVGRVLQELALHNLNHMRAAEVAVARLTNQAQTSGG